MKGIHLEFYGLPGCGKSTVSEIVAKRLEIEGYKVIYASAETGDGVKPLKRRLVKALRTVEMLIKYPHLIKKTHEIVKSNGYKSKVSQIIQINNIAQKLYYYTKDDDAVYVWDQGLTQAAVSLSVKNNALSARENEERLCLLLSLYGQRIKIYIVVTENIALSRMNERTTNNSRVEKAETVEEKRKLLGMFEKECDSIDGQIRVNGSERDVYGVAEEIMKELKKRGLFDKE